MQTKAFFTHEEAPDGQCPEHGTPLLDIGHSTGKLYCPNQGHDGVPEHQEPPAKEEPEWLS